MFLYVGRTLQGLYMSVKILRQHSVIADGASGGKDGNERQQRENKRLLLFSGVDSQTLHDGLRFITSAAEARCM